MVHPIFVLWAVSEMEKFRNVGYRNKTAGQISEREVMGKKGTGHIEQKLVFGNGDG